MLRFPSAAARVTSMIFSSITPEWKGKNKIFHYPNLISNLIFLTKQP
jgi:hypothetical protein